MALPKEYTTATTIVTKSLKFIKKYSSEFGIAIVAGISNVFLNIKEVHDTMEEYKGWKVWRQGKKYCAKKGKNKIKLQTKRLKDIKLLIDKYESIHNKI